MKNNISRSTITLILLFCVFACKNKTQEVQTAISPTEDINALSLQIAQNPNSDSLYLLRAKLYMLNTQQDSAIADLRRAIFIQPKNATYYSLLSENLMLNNDSKNAIQIIDSGLLVLPNDIQLIQDKIRLQLILTQYMEAMATLDLLFLLDPQNAYGYYLAGHVFIESGDTGRAVNSYQKAVDFDPELTVAWIQLGDVLSHMKNPISIKYYDNAIKLNPEDIETRHNKAYALQNLGRIQDAILQYKENILVDSTYELSYYNLGILYKNIDSINESIQMLSKSILLNPEEAYTYYTRGECYLKINDKMAAKKDFEKALSLRPEENDFKKALEKLK